ncbi:MAG: potassium channel family protein [Christensenellales bacterium]|jgi:trk system potassium uptake protein TrkA
MAKEKKQYLIIGAGRFGLALARQLSVMGCEVLAADSEEERVKTAAPYVTEALQLDATDEDALRSLGVRNFDAVIVSIGDNMRDSILVSLMCKEMGAKYLVAKASDDMHARVLQKIGADRVVFPERDGGVRLAKTLISPNVLELINLAGDYMLVDIVAPSSWVGHSLQDIDIRRKYAANVLLINRGNEVMISLQGTTVIQRDDMLLMLGHRKDLEHIEQLG